MNRLVYYGAALVAAIGTTLPGPLVALGQPADKLTEMVLIDVKCPRENGRVLELEWRNQLGWTERIRIDYNGSADGRAKTVELSGGGRGQPLATLKKIGLPVVDWTSKAFNESITEKIRPAWRIC